MPRSLTVAAPSVWFTQAVSFKLLHQAVLCTVKFVSIASQTSRAIPGSMYVYGTQIGFDVALQKHSMSLRRQTHYSPPSLALGGLSFPP